ncbi:hypothetical protein FPOAC2_03757 [Fusarium poae]|jgi:hypothetical protein|uniref:hypothetical protein n=1 Tax=Fusarium poae TaxID=36050 RepID=UPI001CE803D9|nr:hypothetical protein FPOAC1_003650 [Fusarium poae]KAG8677626.1 hypothetical protein FPOAC1_003650 [Fusarium poae]
MASSTPEHSLLDLHIDRGWRSGNTNIGDDKKALGENMNTLVMLILMEVIYDARDKLSEAEWSEE